MERKQAIAALQVWLGESARNRNSGDAKHQALRQEAHQREKPKGKVPAIRALVSGVREGLRFGKAGNESAGKAKAVGPKWRDRKPENGSTYGLRVKRTGLRKKSMKY